MRTKLSRITIRRAESNEDFEQLYRFRYRVYVEEMQRLQRYADHERKHIEEPLDATAANFIAVADGDVVGCLRWNSGQDTDFGEYVELYDMRRAGSYFPHQCGTTTKVMVAPAYRRTALVFCYAVPGILTLAHAVCLPTSWTAIRTWSLSSRSSAIALTAHASSTQSMATCFPCSCFVQTLTTC